MAVHHHPRKETLSVLRNYEQHDRAQLLKALYDLRYTLLPGDEEVVRPLLEHPDDGVVASALFTLWHAFDLRSELEALVRSWAWGDERDCQEMPIQSMAITLLSELAKADPSAREELRAIAEDSSISDVPRKRAWQGLAELYSVEWFPDYSEEMIMSPESEKSEEIRNRIRRAIAKAEQGERIDEGNAR